jgi:hypothetical protein
LIDFKFPRETRDIRSFALVVPAALILVWGVLFLGVLQGRWGGVGQIVVCAVGLLIFLWGRISPETLKPVYAGWMYLTRTVAWFLTTVVLGLVFYLGFTVVGGLMRLFGRDPMRRKLDPAAASYWLRRPPYRFDREHYERQF